LIDLIGIDRVLFGSDWPHAEGTALPWDYAAYLSDCDASERRQIMRENGLRILGTLTPA
jgi:predicted TIM-barrel fold metal-dependent hydrolase